MGAILVCTLVVSACLFALSSCSSNSGRGGPDPSDGHPRVEVSSNLTKGDGGTCPDIPGATLQARNSECLFNEVTNGGKALGEPCESPDDCEGICCVCPTGSVNGSYATKAACIKKVCANRQAACDVLACSGACSN